jgi:patatin-related protein
MRFAVVMYGGVSLAIYINGVVRELLALVRATAPATALGDGAPTETLLAEDELVGTERTYRRLGQLVGWGSQPAADAKANADSPVRTRFIVDVLSGSSAGGINAIFLAKALANEQSLAGLRDLWIEQADLALLVNDNESLQDTTLARQKPARSLLNSRRMYWQVLSALTSMEGTQWDGQTGQSSRLVDELDCWITATDIRGTVLPIDLYDRFVFERKHRKLFHFVYGSEYARGDDVNQFVKAQNPFLAFAARATSAFPFAFEPMELADIDEVVLTDHFRGDYGSLPSSDPAWASFFEEYLKPGGAESVGEAAEDESRHRAFQTQAFGDGGYLDNKPFTAATSTLDRRRADIPVDRRLLYIEPDPGSPHALLKPTLDSWIEHGPLAQVNGAEVLARPNALANVQAALVTLPRYETIREDLERLIERNRQIDRVHEVTQIVDDASLLKHSLPPPPPLDEWRQLSLAAVISNQGLQYGAYHRLKIAAVLDELAQAITKALGLDENSDEYSAIRCFIQAWALRRYPEDGTGTSSQNELLYRYDLSYRLRRIDFLQSRIDILLRSDESALALLRALEPQLAAPSSDDWETLTASLAVVKRALNEALVRIRAAGRALRRRTSDSPLVLALKELQLGREQLRAVLDGAASKQESVQRASDALQTDPTLYAQINDVAEVVANELSTTLAETRETIVSGIDRLDPTRPVAASSQRALRHFFEYYEQYDSVLFPIAYERFGETDRVEVIRISPEDATDIVNEAVGSRRKLGGTQLNHFGGFLDASWRRNDLLWGRLDASERLICTIIPEGETQTELLRDAQIAIIEDEFKDASEETVLDVLLQALMRGAGTDDDANEPVSEEAQQRLAAAVSDLHDPEQILAFLKSGYEVDRRLDPHDTLRTSGRAARVTADVLDGISKSEPVSWLTRWLSRFGLVLWGLVEVSTPQRFAYVFWQYWRQLFLLISVAMVIVGLLFNIAQVAHAGWIGVVLTITLWLAVWALEDVFRRAAKPRSLLPATLPAPGTPSPPKPSRAKRIWHVIRGRALVVLALALALLLLLAIVELWRHIGTDLHNLGDWITSPF